MREKRLIISDDIAPATITSANIASAVSGSLTGTVIVMGF